MKTFHELNEAFPSLLDSNGNRKTFEAFLNDVRKIDNTYNRGYLRAEYNFVQSSAEMAAKWERFSEDGDRYKHLIGGFFVGLLALTPWTAIYAAAVAASCLEFKDKLHGYPWDWIDWACTVLGGSIAMLFFGVLLQIFIHNVCLYNNNFHLCIHNHVPVIV